MVAPLPASRPKKFELLALVAELPARRPKKFELLALVALLPALLPKNILLLELKLLVLGFVEYNVVPLVAITPDVGKFKYVVALIVVADIVVAINPPCILVLPTTCNVSVGVTTPIPILPPDIGVIDGSPVVVEYVPEPNNIPPMLIEFALESGKDIFVPIIILFEPTLFPANVLPAF